MKRILISILAIILCLSAFLGCDKRREDNKGKRLPIVMTIAEPLPNCAVFEYRDKKPYCFYAYDDGGKLYRVFWGNFEGLKERDRIVVDHNDKIIVLDDNESQSEWTPQYEITAIAIYSEEEWNHISKNTSPAEYFQVLKNSNGVIVFSVVAGFPQAKYTCMDSNDNRQAVTAINNESGEINSLLFNLLHGKSTTTDENNSLFTDCISMTCSYTSDDGYAETTVVYEFKWSSTSNTVTIYKNNTLIGTVLLSVDEMNELKSHVNQFLR